MSCGSLSVYGMHVKYLYTAYNIILILYIVSVCLCVYCMSQRLLIELIINKPFEPLDFIIDFLKRDDDGELQDVKDHCLSQFSLMVAPPFHAF